MIGTTTEGFASYGDKFTIADSGHCGMTIRSGSSNYGTIYFSDNDDGSADEVRGFLEYNHSTNELGLGSNGTHRIRISSVGQVNIGTKNNGTAPAGNGTFTDISLNTDGGDLATGRIFLQGYQKSANSDFLTGVNNEGASLVLYDYSNNHYKQKWHKNGGTELWYGSNNRLETTSTGVDISGATDGVLNINTTDGRGSFIRLKYNGSTKVWVGSSEGFGVGDQDDGALMAVDKIYLMSGQTRRIIINGSGMAELYGGQSSYPWGATFRNSGEVGGYNSIRCFFEGTNGQSNRTYSIMSENGKFRISGGGTAGSSTGSQLVYLSSTTATSWTGGSDIRLKENITEIPNVLDKVKNYRCARFNFIGDDASDIQNIKFGFIAQDWVDDFPEVLSTSTKDADDPTDTTEYYGMQYTETIPVLLKAIQELNAKVETLQNEVNTLKSS